MVRDLRRKARNHHGESAAGPMAFHLPPARAREEMGEVTRNDLIHYMFQFIKRIPNQHDRRIVELRLEGRSYSEIAEELGKTEGAVSQAHWRIVKRLRDLLNLREDS